MLTTLTNENGWRGCDMKTFQEVIESMEQYRSLDDVVLDEAGNFSAGVAIKNCITIVSTMVGKS